MTADHRRAIAEIARELGELAGVLARQAPSLGPDEELELAVAYRTIAHDALAVADAFARDAAYRERRP